MDRLRQIASFLVVVAVVFAALRAVHLLVPAFLPTAVRGPVPLDDLASVERYTGFSPLMPSYHPISLGPDPVEVEVWPKPRGRVEVTWRREAFLTLSQTTVAEPPPRPSGAPPLQGVPDSSFWTAGGARHLVMRRGPYWLELTTDLLPEDLHRIATTLHPLD